MGDINLVRIFIMRLGATCLLLGHRGEGLGDKPVHGKQPFKEVCDAQARTEGRC